MATFNARARRRGRRWLCEICGDGGVLLRRERFTTATAADAASILRELCPIPPGARWAHFYATADEPHPVPKLSIRL